MNDNDKLYIVSLSFILVSLLLGDKIMELFKSVNKSLSGKVLFTCIIAVLYTVIYLLGFRNTSESFFFQVSKCNPKCSGAYYGKPATFQFTPLSSSGTTCPDKNCGYGMISECKYPECQQILQKYGGPSPNSQL